MLFDRIVPLSLTKEVTVFKKNHIFTGFGLVDQIIFTGNCLKQFVQFPQILPDVLRTHLAFYCGELLTITKLNYLDLLHWQYGLGYGVTINFFLEFWSCVRIK